MGIKQWIIVIVMCFCSPLVFSGESIPTHQLQLVAFTKIDLTPNETANNSLTAKISGMGISDENLLYVTDDDKNYSLFSTPLGMPGSARLNFLRTIDYSNHFKEHNELVQSQTGQKLKIDGMAYCRKNDILGILFLANSKFRDVMKFFISGKHSRVFIPIQDRMIETFPKPQSNQSIQDYLNSPEIKKISTSIRFEKTLPGIDGENFTFVRDYTNTLLFGNREQPFDDFGFTGVGVNCTNGNLYIAKSQKPAYIIHTDFMGNFRSIIPLPEYTEDFRVVRNPETGEGNYVIEPEISDLFYADDSLFILEKNIGKITELDASTGNLIAKYDYSQWENIYSQTNPKNGMELPFGMAEGLVVTKTGYGNRTKKTFYIGFNTNYDPTIPKKDLLTKINEKGLSVFGCSTQNFESEQKKRYLNRLNCLNKDEPNPVVLKLQEL